jgi:hypothetical protein
MDIDSILFFVHVDSILLFVDVIVIIKGIPIITPILINNHLHSNRLQGEQQTQGVLHQAAGGRVALLSRQPLKQ